MFVIRVAGMDVAQSQIGSVEFAAERFGTRLVSGHGANPCGAIARPSRSHGGTGLLPQLLSIAPRRPGKRVWFDGQAHDTVR